MAVIVQPRPGRLLHPPILVSSIEHEDQAAIRFRRQPIKAIPARAEANRGKAAGTGMTVGGGGVVD